MNTVKLDGTNGADTTRRTHSTEVAERAGIARHQAPEPGVAPDAVEVSKDGAAVGRLIARVKELPDVRQDKVAEFRSQIQTGSYKPSARDIADTILRSEG
jgi:negative regulator of flagellin synthesis FlgM